MWGKPQNKKVNRRKDGEGLLRVAVGLESLADLKADLARGLG